MLYDRSQKSTLEHRRRGGSHPVVLTRNDEAVAIALEDADLERLLMSRFERLQRLLSESREQIARGEVLTADQLFAHLKP